MASEKNTREAALGTGIVGEVEEAGYGLPGILHAMLEGFNCS